MTTTVNTAFICEIKPDGSQGETWRIEDKPMVVGRGDCAEACVDDDSLSRSHFLVVREREQFFLVDLHSSNGTRVNGTPVAAHRLQPDEIIEAGDTAFWFRTAPIAAPSLPGHAPDSTSTQTQSN